MADKKYDFHSTICVKIAVQKGDKIFLIKEPETNEWMPYFRLIKRKPKGEEFIDISRIKTTRRSPHK